jgi:hypothetical protein
MGLERTNGAEKAQGAPPKLTAASQTLQCRLLLPQTDWTVQSHRCAEQRPAIDCDDYPHRNISASAPLEAPLATEFVVCQM